MGTTPPRRKHFRLVAQALLPAAFRLLGMRGAQTRSTGNGAPTRRDLLSRLSRGAALLGLGGSATYLVQKAHGQIVWQVDASKCVNSRVGDTAVEACNLCTNECVVLQSAVRAVNDFANCGRCSICPAYFNIKSAVDPATGLPSEKRCPRDAITRKPIGLADPQDPANNYYEYVIDEKKCDGCGKCVMGCKEPMGLGSVRLMVRHSLCVDCNRCSISVACPKDAIDRIPVSKALVPQKAGSHGPADSEWTEPRVQ